MYSLVILRRDTIYGCRMTFWLETDLEPDDLLALVMLPKADVYVVGESIALVKKQRLQLYLEMMHHTEATIVEGLDSDRVFANEGAEFQFPDRISAGESGFDVRRYLELLTDFSQREHPQMIVLKPPRELILAYQTYPEMRNTLAKITCYIYGGFNFRAIKHAADLVSILESFNTTYIYESYHVTGADNSLNADTYPEIYQYIMSHNHHPLIEAILQSTKTWNQHMAKRLKALPLTPRRQKILTNIAKNLDFQFVLADVALAAVFAWASSNPITDLHFDADHYLKFQDEFETAGASNVRIYKAISPSLLGTSILSMLKIAMEKIIYADSMAKIMI